MTSNATIGLIQSHENDMRERLLEFSKKALTHAQDSDSAFDLWIKMGWFEKNVSRLPFLETARAKEYRKKVDSSTLLFMKTIPLMRSEIIGKLKEFIADLKEESERVGAENEREGYAITRALEEFNAFFEKFAGYNYYLYAADRIDVLELRAAYPDAEKIYERALREYDKINCIFPI